MPVSSFPRTLRLTGITIMGALALVTGGLAAALPGATAATSARRRRAGMGLQHLLPAWLAYDAG